jgi:AcrR family transcriptional regulator
MPGPRGPLAGAARVTLMPVFFDPQDYLARDPAEAASPVEAERLRREAEQRARLCEALTELAAERGFEAVSIQQIFGRAKLGSGTYYKLFADREACLAEAFERCATVALGRVEAAGRAHGGDLAGRVEAGLRELLELLSEHPAIARLLLVEVLAGDAGCREARQRWLGCLAGLFIGGEQEDLPGVASLAWMTAGAMTSVLALAIRTRGSAKGAAPLAELTRIARWPQLRSEAGAATGVPAATEVDDALRKERPRKKRAASAARRKEQRERMLAVMIQLAGERGYEGARVSEVLERTGLSQPLFYSHFSSKEECLLAAFDAALAPIEERVRAATANEGEPADRAQAGLRELVASLTERPEVARLATVEVRKAGSSGEERYAEAFTRLAQQVMSGGADGEPSEAPRMVGAAIGSMISQRVAAGRATELAGSLPELVFAALAPSLGGEEALAVAREASAPQAR